MPGFNINIKESCNDGPQIPGSREYFGPSINTETARVHRFALSIFEPFGNLSNGILIHVSKCTRPTVEIDEIVIHNGQDEIYRPGKNRWQPIEFTFYETLQDSDVPFLSMTAQLMFKLWAEKAIKLQRSAGGSPTNFCSDMQLDMLNGVGETVWSYHLYRAWPIKVSPKDLSYSSSDISEISVTLRFDKAMERRK